MIFHPYPQDLPVSAIKYLADLFLNREVFDKSTVGNAVYAVQGTLQKFILGEPGEEVPIMPAMALPAACTVSADDLTAEHVAATLTALLPQEETPDVQQGLFGGIGTALLFSALQRILKSLLGGTEDADQIIDDVVAFLKEIITG